MLSAPIFQQRRDDGILNELGLQPHVPLLMCGALPLLMPQCPTNAWSVTYPTSFWNESYCGDASGQQAGVCAAGNPTRPAACDLDIPPEALTSFPSNSFVPSVLAFSCPALDVLVFVRGAVPASARASAVPSFRSAVCDCLRNPHNTADVSDKIANSLNAVLGFNFTTLSVAPLRDVGAPAQCSNATFVPARNLYVCNAEGVAANSTDACKCPKSNAFYTWSSPLTPTGCFDFVTAAAEGGKCLAPSAAPAAPARVSVLPPQSSDIGRCRIFTCPCPEAPSRVLNY